MTNRAVPPDCTLLPTQSGALLVSPSHATFCAIPRKALAAMSEVIAGRARVEALDCSMLSALEEHGFFGAPRPAPPPAYTVSLQLTNACNLRCGYCCTNSLAPRSDELALDDWKQVVGEAHAAFGSSVRFALLGGEPLLVPWALDLAEHVASLDARLALYTNGIALRDPPIARRVAGLIRQGTEVRVSLAGATRETCDRHSGVLRFDRVLEGLDELAHHGETALVDLMLFPQDVMEVANALPALRGRLPTGTRVSLGIGYHGGRESGEHVFASRADLEAALDRVALDAGEEIAATPCGPTADRRDGCACALGQSLNVRSDGRLFSCFRMEEPVGDLASGTFAETLVALRAKPQPAAALQPCSSCALVSLCGGGCRSENLLYTGDADRPVCGPWRVSILSELLADDRVSCLEWSAVQLAGEARQRGIDAPNLERTVRFSLHMHDR